MYAATFDQLVDQLREFRHFDSRDPPYDANGAFMIFSAILDNLATNYREHDFEDRIESPPVLSQEQAKFLQQLLLCHEIAKSNSIGGND